MLPSFFKKLGPIDINKIKSTIKCETVNVLDSDIFYDFVNIDKIKKNTLSFLYDNETPKKEIPNSSTVICTKKTANCLSATQKIIIVSNVQESVAKISNIFFRDFSSYEKNKFQKPDIGKNCKIDDTAIIENGVVIGDNVKINHNAVIKHGCVIGTNTEIDSNATISNSLLGENIYIGSNSSIGQKGFGFYISHNNNINIYHSGRVILRSKVSIGSGCSIDRGSFSDTIIGENTYLDNNCHIAHNVEIGNNCAFAAMTGIAGSTKVGNNVLTGGQVGIAGHISIGNNVKIAAKSGVFHNLDDGASVMGYPAMNKYTFIKKYKKIYGKKPNKSD